MRVTGLILLIALLCPMLTGCSGTVEMENRAYALVLGVDAKQGGGLELTIRVPRVGKDGFGESQKGAGESEDYMLFSAEGTTFSQALDHLQWAVPRELNLSHIVLLVVSEAIAREEGFRETINRIAQTQNLYTAARFAVCSGTARAFIEAQKVTSGTRLSSDIEAMFRHYATHGFIPDASFAEVYYASNSIYSDPAAAWADLGPVGSGSYDAQQSVSAGESSDTSHLSEKPFRQNIIGAAVFKDGTLACRLDSDDTLYMNLIRSESCSFQFELGG